MNWNIKDECVSCGGWIPKTQRHYIVYGNYCSRCSIKADKLTKIKSGIEHFEKIDRRISDLKEKKAMTMLTMDERIQLTLAEATMKKIMGNKSQHPEVLTRERDRVIASLPNYTDLDFHQVFGL